MSLATLIKDRAIAARASLPQLLALQDQGRQRVLRAVAAALNEAWPEVESANQLDLAAGQSNGLAPAMLDRLTLTRSRFDSMVSGLLVVADLPDPVGKELHSTTRPNGLLIKKVQVPIGVVAIIYEARPNVTLDSFALCFRSGNASILRGGSEAINTNRKLVEILQSAGHKAGMPTDCLHFIDSTDREAVGILAKLDGFVDLIVPRGGEGLIRAVTAVATVPVIKHYKGVCHVFVDQSADQQKALAIVENAKCQRPGVCNALETLLVHEAVAAEFLPKLAAHLNGQVELRADEHALQSLPSAHPATEADWSEEYLDLILSIKVVPDVGAAIEHINHYGSHHSDAIISEDEVAQHQFLELVDSAAVYVNASTRFTDGFEFGLGAEIGISTDKLHARGPMGVEGLMTYKWLVLGDGQIRA